MTQSNSIPFVVARSLGGSGALLRAAAAAALLALSACAVVPPADEDAVKLSPVTFRDLPGWRGPVTEGARTAWRASCRQLLTLPPDKLLGPRGIAGTAGAWQPACRKILQEDVSVGQFAAFIEQSFVPYRVHGGAGDDGLFTGYFEPVVRAAEKRSDVYRYPIYRLPSDHVAVNLSDFDPALANQQIVGRVDNGRLRPYYERGVIDKGVLGADGGVLYWAQDQLDVFILQVQGSGIVELPDGRRRRIGFAGHNGHDYASIGRLLIAQGEVTPHEASWQGIRRWMESNPDRVAALLAHNKRYIFFKQTEGAGPKGVAGIELTPGHSLAIDPQFMPLNVPLWLDIDNPLPGGGRLQRLVMSQDVGNAIRGPIRGDLYWGSGPAALEVAGRMKSKGDYFLLLPKPIIGR